MVSMPPALFAIFLAILWLFTYCDETKSRKIHLRQSGSKRIANKRWKVARQVGLRKCVPTLREVTSTHFACYSAKVPINYTKARDARYYSIVFSTELIGLECEKSTDVFLDDFSTCLPFPFSLFNVTFRSFDWWAMYYYWVLFKRLLCLRKNSIKTINRLFL